MSGNAKKEKKMEIHNNNTYIFAQILWQICILGLDLALMPFYNS